MDQGNMKLNYLWNVVYIRANEMLMWSTFEVSLFLGRHILLTLKNKNYIRNKMKERTEEKREGRKEGRIEGKKEGMSFYQK